ncbi:MAG: chitobiase/beta-hexosaminidase C-terminal domain-containing protein [Bacteroidales bacterium]|nr:chitobiase/beta-hexosaminidase C-terminal domain-containing protein [Bacteroidales bacterium]
MNRFFKTLKRGILLALLCAAVQAQAQTANGYVIYSSDDGYFLTHNANTGAVSTAAVTAFDVRTCLWTISGNYIRPVSDNGTTVLENLYLRPRNGTGNNNYVLNTNTSTNYADWSGGLSNGGQPYYGTGNQTRYLRWSGSGNAWQVNTYDSHRGTVYAVTRYDVAASLTDFEINGPNVLSGNGNYSHTKARYEGSYYDYQFNGTHNYAGRPDPVEVTTGYTWSLSGAAGYAGVDPATGTITVTSFPANDIEMTLTCSVTNDGLTKTATKEILLQGTTVAAPTFTRSGNSVTLATATTGATIYYTTDGSTPSSSSTAYSGPIDIASLSFPVTVKAIAIRNGNSSDAASETYSQPACEVPVITVGSGGVVTITCATEGTTIRYTSGDNPADPTGSSPIFSTLTLTSGQSVKAIATKSGYDNSAVATVEYVQSGVSGGKVTLDDREPHSWSYYSDASTPEQLHSLNPVDVKITYYGDGIVMTGNTDYTASSTDFVQPGNANYVGGAKVNVGGEDENTFVYYKTLERENADGTGRCPYKPIPNPFQVRPTYGTRGSTDANDFTGWRGFQCWRLKSVSGGAVYSVASGGTALTTGAVINAETEIYFAPTAEYGMEVELEAVWAIAYVKKANQANENPVGTNNVGYERNFCVPTTGAGYTLYTGNGKRITNANHIPVTISCYYPDGTAPDNTANSISNTATSLTADTKFENISINMTSNTLTLANYDIIVGRGCGSSTINNLQGINAGATDLDYTIRVESGTFNQFCFVRDGTNTTVSGRYLIKAIMGSDYDRATGTNNKLIVSPNSTFFLARTVGFTGSSNKDQKTFDCVFKSGTYQSGYWNGTSQNGQNAYLNIAYLGQNSAQGNTYPGVRCVTVEGGEFGGMCGGRGVSNNSNNSTYVTPEVIVADFRIKGGTFHGAVFGGAADNPSIGSRRFIITGGTIQSWLAGGCNGTGSQSGTGATDGDSYIYVGGTALVGGDDLITVNDTYGGQVFGAGRGISGRASSVNHSHVVVADEAVIRNGNNNNGNVYGGSYNGTIADVSNVYITGGTVEGKVFGGSFGNGNTGAIPAANITMTGGLVTDGVFGGSNSTGTVNNVTMHIDGGQVGTSSVNANVHGGGYGQSTSISGNVDLNLGTCGAASGATIYGDVYGGSALGSVNTNANNTTTVSLYKGTIYGGLYGGALGDAASLGAGHSNVAAAVNGKVAVKVMGGSVLCSASDPDGEAGTGSVFGCNNVNGTPASTVTVDIYNTDQPLSGYALHAVYGGGNKAAYNGTPVVNIHGCSNSIEYVYGGGNAADVAGTNVTIWGGKIGNAFGGGNGFSAANPPNHNNPSAAHYNPGADITSSGTHLTIHGGTIGAAFGGSNQYGTITGGVNVDVIDDSETGNDPCGNSLTSCTMDIAELYGGGNEAPLISSRPSTYIGQNDIHVNLDCSARVGMLFGGAKKADYVGNINLVVNGGTFNKVFGGNNQGGTITGNVTMTFNGGKADEVYGGCNEDGDITGTIIVNIDSTNSTCNPPFWVGNVYGGGNEAAYSHAAGYPEVNIINGTVRQNVYGGGFGSTAVVTGTPKVTIGVSDANKKASVLGNVFGGGNAAGITGSTDVNVISNSTVKGNVFGGGNEAPVSANTHVWIRDRVRVYGNIYGGGNRGEIGGDTKVIVNSL